MKTVRDAVIQFDAKWPDGADALITTSDKWQHLNHVVGEIRPVKFCDSFSGYEDFNGLKPVVNEFSWVALCSKQQFESEITLMISEQCQSIIKSEYVSGLQSESSWFGKGEFPPSGAYCQFLLTDGSNKWANCFIIGIDDLGFCVCRADMDYFASMSPASFRPVEPVKTDCQKFIESAIDAAIVDNGVPVEVVPYMNEIFERMFHAGFKSPEQNK